MSFDLRRPRRPRRRSSAESLNPARELIQLGTREDGVWQEDRWMNVLTCKKPAVQSAAARPWRVNEEGVGKKKKKKKSKAKKRNTNVEPERKDESDPESMRLFRRMFRQSESSVSILSRGSDTTSGSERSPETGRRNSHVSQRSEKTWTERDIKRGQELARERVRQRWVEERRRRHQMNVEKEEKKKRDEKAARENPPLAEERLTQKLMERISKEYESVEALVARQETSIDALVLSYLISPRFCKDQVPFRATLTKEMEDRVQAILRESNS